MGRAKRDLGVDKYGVKKMMRKRDYLGDMTGMVALGIMGNIVGQITYFYTDKVGLAVGGIGIVLLISKVIDAVTDVLVGNIIDHSKGGNKKYLRWMIRLTIPAGLSIILMFTVPRGNNVIGLIYILLSNVLLSAIIGTFIGTPYSAIQIVRTNSQMERSTMGTFRSLASYLVGMVMAIGMIPITNILGGDQKAWIKFAVGSAIVAVVMLLICYFTGRNAEFTGEKENEEETSIPFKEAVKNLFHNKYWVMVLVFNLLSATMYAITGASGAYYCKWIFGNDNLVGILGAIGLIPTVLGFALARPMIGKLGVRKTVYTCLVIGVIGSIAKCLFPVNFMVNAIGGCIVSFANIPIMCLYGVFTGMAVDYNEYLYGEKMVAISGGATSFGNKVGGGIGSVILTVCLAIGGYNAAAETATTAMRYSIYAFSNYLPLVILIAMFFLFTKFDIADRIADIQAEVAARKEKQEEK